MFLMVIVMTSFALAEQASQSPSPPNNKETLFNNSNSILGKDPNFSIATREKLDTRQMFFKMMLALLIVFVLGAAVYYVSKKLGTKMVNLPGKKIHIIETTYLGPRKSVHLLQIGKRKILIGSTAERIMKLTDWIEGPSNQLETEEKGSSQ